jgi:excinuclease ABC subunit B
MGDQPEAIKQLVEGVQKGYRDQVLLGATGTGKTFTMANIIQQLQMPALVMAHNKTLAAQLYAEFKEFFPDNAVEYFVSYYDYYQPEAYVPRTICILKKKPRSMKRSTACAWRRPRALMSRRDVIIVASVSCIYGLGNPETYGKTVISLENRQLYRRNALLRQLVESQYQRNDVELRPGVFRVRGDTLEVFPAYEDRKCSASASLAMKIERIMEVNPVSGEVYDEPERIDIFPAKHYITEQERLKEAIEAIEKELEERLRTSRTTTNCWKPSASNSARATTWKCCAKWATVRASRTIRATWMARTPGSPPWTLMDYLPSDYLLFGRVAYDRSADPRYVLWRPLAQDHPGRVWFPPALGDG